MNLNGLMSLAVGLLWLAAPANAQATFPKGPITYQWEITNRFSPFEPLPDPAGVFDTYRIREEDRDLEGWHKRLDARPRGMTSPFEPALRRGRALHWDMGAQRHRDVVLRYVNDEANQSVNVDLRLEGAEGWACEWSLEPTPIPCEIPLRVSIPMTGAFVSVQVGDLLIERFLRPRHEVIVAFGDSYGSGEGNPDVPAQWKDLPPAPNLDTSWLHDTWRYEPLPARRWIDDQCHRSFFSHQTLTAMEIASRDPHVFVSYLHYACTGAEIFDGILAPQYQPAATPGYLNYSQINAALQDLCSVPLTTYGSVTDEEVGALNLRAMPRRGGATRNHTDGTMLRPGDRFDRWARNQRTETGLPYPRSGLMDCPEGNRRAPDRVFVSIGGNDIGFGDLISYYIVPIAFKTRTETFFVLPDVCPAEKYRMDPDIYMNAYLHCLDREKYDGDAGRLIGVGQRGGIAERYMLLFSILTHRLGIEREDIVMAQYPDPLRFLPSQAPACDPLSEGDLFVHGAQENVFDPLSPWNGLKSAAPLPQVKSWRFNLTEFEARNLLMQFDELRGELSKTAAREGITFVCDTRDALVGRGWWIGDHLNLPNHTRGFPDNRWSPADWAPYKYEAAGRGIITGNDSVLTQPHPKTNIIGTAHPNVTGHRLMADMVARQLLGERAENGESDEE